MTCGMYTIEETALANGIHPEKYLEYLFRRLPYTRKDGFNYSDCLPWSKRLLEDLRISKKDK